MAKTHAPGPALRFVAAALIVRDKEVLIGQRRADQPMASLWEFPGGKIEPGESPQQALARELTEELGIRRRSRPRRYADPAPLPPRRRRGPAVFCGACVRGRDQQPDLSAGALGQARRPARLRFSGRRPRADPGSGGGKVFVRQLSAISYQLSAFLLNSSAAATTCCVPRCNKLHCAAAAACGTRHGDGAVRHLVSQSDCAGARFSRPAGNRHPCGSARDSYSTHFASGHTPPNLAPRARDGWRCTSHEQRRARH